MATDTDLTDCARAVIFKLRRMRGNVGNDAILYVRGGSIVAAEVRHLLEQHASREIARLSAEGGA